VFDAIVITISWVFEGSDLAVMRSFRIFRLFTMIAKWTSLRHLFKAIGKTMPKMGTIAAVLLLFFYSFCVFYTNLYFGLYEEGVLDWDYFGRLDLTFLTLFQVMTMDSWTVMVRQLMDSGHQWAWVGFVIWVVITAFFFISLIVAVVCESLFELNDIKEKRRQKKMFKHQNNVVKNQTKVLMDENKELLEIQKEMLANQIVMQKTLMEVVDQLREYEKNGANDRAARASQSEAAQQSLSEKSMSSLLATFEADGTIRRSSDSHGSTRRASTGSKVSDMKENS
jgi:voltage-gated sodium channel